MTRAVVCAYHNVGVRCLSVLLAHGVDVALVLTHRDNPNETIWFDSVADLATLHGIPVETPDDPNTPQWLARLKDIGADVLFSFYYRSMLRPELLAAFPHGAYNMHGSLLPAYRGRVPVNWAVIRGERRTGATLHAMVAKPDAGDIVDQQAVPILPDDTALEVFHKVTVAAEVVLDRALPGLLDGSAVLQPQDLAAGSYFSGRKAEDGRIDWRQDAQTLHNLVRGVAPPYPGAYCDLAGSTLRILRTWLEPARRARGRSALRVADGLLLADCADGRVLRILQAEWRGDALDAAGFRRHFGEDSLPLT